MEMEHKYPSPFILWIKALQDPFFSFFFFFFSEEGERRDE